MKITNGYKIIEATEKAFDVVYKNIGYSIYIEPEIVEPEIPKEEKEVEKNAKPRKPKK